MVRRVDWSPVEELWGRRELFIGMVRERFRCSRCDAEEVLSEVLGRCVVAAAEGRPLVRVFGFALAQARFVWVDLCADARCPVDGRKRRNKLRREEIELAVLSGGGREMIDGAAWAVEGVLLAFDEARRLSPVQRAVFEAAVRIAAEGTFEHPRRSGEGLLTRVARGASELLGREVGVRAADAALRKVQARMRRCARSLVAAGGGSEQQAGGRGLQGSSVAMDGAATII